MLRKYESSGKLELDLEAPSSSMSYMTSLQLYEIENSKPREMYNKKDYLLVLFQIIIELVRIYHLKLKQ